MDHGLLLLRFERFKKNENKSDFKKKEIKAEKYYENVKKCPKTVKREKVMQCQQFPGPSNK